MPFKLHEIINTAISAALVECGISHKATSRISTGNGFDRQCNDIMAIAKKLKIDSKELATKVVGLLQSHSYFEKVEVGGNGFINMKLSEAAILAWSYPIDVRNDFSQDVLIDFGGPNIAKELHVGHLRSLVIGESLRRILKLRGHNVVSDIHIGDWGLPMGMLIALIMQEYPGWPFTMDSRIIDFEKLYPIAVAKCKEDAELMKNAQSAMVSLQSGERSVIWEEIRKTSLAKIKPSIARLGAYFDEFGGESSVANLMNEVMEAIEDYTQIDNGAVIIDVMEPTDNTKIPPLIYRKSNEGFTYAATDLATIYDRWTSLFCPRKVIYVVDNRHDLHFKQLFRAAKKVFPYMDVEFVHTKFGTVNGSDGKPYKTRDGGVPTLDWMLDTAVAKAKERTEDQKDAEIIGIGAIKFADLITNRESGYVFDIDRIMALEGKTGPYLQYACVRIQHILDKVDTSPSRTLGKVKITCEEERDLLVACANCPEIFALAERFLAPNYIAEYAYTLAQKFSVFYASCPVIDNSVVNLSRVEICLTVQGILTRCLYLLGIDIPEKM